MKKFNVIIYIALIAGAYFYFVHENKTERLTKETTPPIPESNQPTSGDMAESKDTSTGNIATGRSPGEIPSDELPEDIKKAATRTESNNPDDLPPDLKAQLNAPPPELPEDLRRQLEMEPQELPPDLKAQLESPPPPIPDDIKRALAIPPRVVSIEEVNTPFDTIDANDEEIIE